MEQSKVVAALAPGAPCSSKAKPNPQGRTKQKFYLEKFTGNKAVKVQKEALEVELFNPLDSSSISRSAFPLQAACSLENQGTAMLQALRKSLAEEASHC